MQMLINNKKVEVQWENNPSVQALEKLTKENPLTVHMSMYGGFEQVGSLGHTLPASDRHITTQSGDIMLYCANQIVVFYGSNSWSYTRLGKIINQSNSQLRELLGNGDVTITINR